MNKIDQEQNLEQFYFAYKNLLTEKQRNIYELYFFEDLSINEIAELQNVSKTNIFRTIKKIIVLLKDYEDKLHLIKQYNYIKKKLSKKNINFDSLLEEIQHE